MNCSDKDAVQSDEEPFFSESACLDTAVISDAGHDLNLLMIADAAYAHLRSWLTAMWTEARSPRSSLALSEPCSIQRFMGGGGITTISSSTL